MAQAPALVGSATPEAVNRISLPLLRIQERRLLLATMDSFLCGGVLLFAYEIWKAGVHPAADNMDSIPWAWVVGGALSWFVISWLGGNYDLEIADRMLPGVRRTLVVTMFVAVEGLAAYWIFLKTYPRPALAIALASAPLAIVLWRLFYAAALSRPESSTRILVLGSDEARGSLALATANNPYYEVVGAVSSLGPKESSLDILAGQLGVHRIVVVPGTHLTEGLVGSLTDAIERGVEVVDYNSAYEEIAEKVSVEYVADQWPSALPTRVRTSSFEEIAIRAIDICGGLAGLMIAIPFLPLIMVAVALSSPGPILFRQTRLGRGSRPFTIFKFRTMSMDAEASGASWACLDDPRVTRVGRFLRQTHLDELPQLWNVLLGEMSLVGPRPERPEFTDSLAQEIPFYRLRLSVRPGLTGLKQIKVGYAASFDEHLEVLRHDLYYIKHRSLALNLAIMARTIGSVISREGR